MDGTGHLVENLETTFQNCFSALTSHEHYNASDTEEMKSSVEQNIQKLLDVSRQLEIFFLQKRQLLSIHKPEQLLKEEISDMKQELARKDVLIQKHHEKLQHWQTMLKSTHSGQQQQPGGQAGSQGVPTGMQAGIQGSGAPGHITTTPQTTSSSLTVTQTSTAGFPQGPLAYLEQTTSNIGSNEQRR